MRAHSKRGSRGCQLAPSPGPLVVVIMLSRVHVRVRLLQPQTNHNARHPGLLSLTQAQSVRVTKQRHQEFLQLQKQGGARGWGPLSLLSWQRLMQHWTEGGLERQQPTHQQYLWQQQEQHRLQQRQVKLQPRVLRTAALYLEKLQV